MTQETDDRDKRVSSLWILAMVNVFIWAVSIIAMVFVMQHSPAIKKLYPVLAGGTVVSIILFSALLKLR
jgi:flagellar basal body-associated protein FliL